METSQKFFIVFQEEEKKQMFINNERKSFCTFNLNDGGENNFDNQNTTNGFSKKGFQVYTTVETMFKPLTVVAILAVAAFALTSGQEAGQQGPGAQGPGQQGSGGGEPGKQGSGGGEPGKPSQGQPGIVQAKSDNPTAVAPRDEGKKNEKKDGLIGALLNGPLLKPLLKPLSFLLNPVVGLVDTLLSPLSFMLSPILAPVGWLLNGLGRLLGALLPGIFGSDSSEQQQRKRRAIMESFMGRGH